jgi:hypothetical protein
LKALRFLKNSACNPAYERLLFCGFAFRGKSKQKPQPPEGIINSRPAIPCRVGIFPALFEPYLALHLCVKPLHGRKSYSILCALFFFADFAIKYLRETPLHRMNSFL